MRLVGDVAFLLHNYELAYSMHHSLKKELQGKELSLLYAQALVRRERAMGRVEEKSACVSHFCRKWHRFLVR